MSSLDKVFKALSDPNRLRIVNILMQRDACVCEIQAILNLPQAFLSRHLAYLRNSGIARDRREGPRVYYSLSLRNDEAGRALREFLAQILPALEDHQKDLAKLKEFLNNDPLSRLSEESSQRGKAI